MSRGLREDLNGGSIQGFAPSRVVTITAAAAWTPDDADRAFRVGVQTNYFMNSDSGHEATLVAGSITVLFNRGQTFTFDTTLELEVM